MISLEIRRGLIEKGKEGGDGLLGIARSSLYYTPTKMSGRDQELMEALDRLYYVKKLKR